MNNVSHRKIKVVFGINAFVVGGEKKLINFFKFLPQSEFDLFLVTLFRSPEEEIYHLLPEYVKVFKFDFKSSKDFRNIFKLYRCLKSIKPDIVASGLFLSNTIFRALKPFVGFVSVAMELNTYTDKTKFQILIDRILSKLSYRIVAVSKTVAEFTSNQERIPPDKFLVIHNGVDLEKIERDLSVLPPKDQLKERMGFSAEDKIFINVARLTPQKNHRLLIQSFAEFVKKNPQSVLLVIGPGGLKENLENLVSDLGIGNKIKIMGSKENLTPYYASSDFFISTSVIEGLSNAYLEAMAHGLPLIATKTAGTDELIEEGKNGFFINDFSVESVVSTMNRAIDIDSNYGSLSAGALRTAQGFSIHRTTDKFRQLFWECLKNDEIVH